MLLTKTNLAIIAGLPSLLLIVLLLGDTFYQLVIIFIALICVTPFFCKVSWENIFLYQKEFTLWLVWVISWIATSIWTHHIPLVLESSSILFFSFIFFSIVLLLPKKTLPINLLYFQLITLTTVLSVISLIFTFIPNIGVLLPGKNLVFASYGHNHLAAFLLLIIPINWWTYLKEIKSSQNKWLHIALLSTLFIMYTLLFSSFGRIATIIGTLQLVYIWFFWLKKPFSLNKVVKKTALFFTTMLLLLLGFKLFFGFASLMGIKITCPLPEPRLCKSLNNEPRLAYWDQALKAIHDYPLTGYGPKTFSFINLKYKQTPDLGTSYAHNAFIQAWAETGLITGTFFLVLMVYLLYKSTKVVHLLKNQPNYLTPMWLGLVSIYFNNLFDFDWEFLGVWLVTLLFIAMILKHQPLNIQTKYTQIQKHLAIKNIVIIALLFCGQIITIYTGAYLWTEWQIHQKNMQLALQFPYFNVHKDLFLAQRLTPEQIQKLIFLYENDSKFVYNARQKLKNDGFPFDPTTDTTSDPWTQLQTMNTLDEVIGLAQLIENARQKYQYDNHLVTHGTALKMVGIVKPILNSSWSTESIHAYILAVKTSPWVLHETGLPYEPTNIFIREKCLLLQQLLPIDEYSFGDAKEPFANEYVRCILNQPDTLAPEVIAAFKQKITALTPWRVNESILTLENS